MYVAIIDKNTLNPLKCSYTNAGKTLVNLYYVCISCCLFNGQQLTKSYSHIRV